MSDHSTAGRSPERRGRYTVERTLGRGGMASVYLARDTELGRPVALKALAPHLAEEEGFRARFLREARLAARLAHPNVVQVYDVGEDEHGPFIVTEYVEGQTLADELRERGRFSPEQAVELAIQVCAGLEAAHGAGLVHRDIKPQNILLRRDGTAKIADFGIARSRDATILTEQGTVLGTAAYLAPEQARGEPVTAAADLYALGAVLYEMLTGRRPFQGETLPELLIQREQGAIKPPSELTPRIVPELENVIMRCLALNPDYRPESAAALARMLAATLPEPLTQPLPEPTGIRATEVLTESALPTRPLRRAPSNWGRLPAALRRPSRALPALAAGLLLALGLAFGFILDRPTGGESQRTATTGTAAPAQQQPTVEPTTAAQRPTALSCSEIEERKRELEEEKKAIEERKRQTKDKAQRDALEQQKRAIDDRKRELDEERKSCR